LTAHSQEFRANLCFAGVSIHQNTPSDRIVNEGGSNMALHLNRSPIAHIRFEGKSLDLPLAELGVGESAGNDELKQAAARYLEVSAKRLRDYVVDRHESGNVTIRPQAVFG
jgi:hypothetical protein